MLGLSLLLHIALIAFIPGFGIFLPAGDTPFIEIETIVLSPEIGADAGAEADAENPQGEFVVQPELSVSEPGTFESPHVIDEWERIVLERESHTLDVPTAETVVEHRPPIEAEALAVQIERSQNVSKPSPEQPDRFERPNIATADEMTEEGEQPFDLASLRGEEPLAALEEEFTRTILPEPSEFRRDFQPQSFADASRNLSIRPDALPARSFQPQTGPRDDLPEIRLPERQDFSETEDETFSLPPEELHIARQDDVVPDSEEIPDFQARPLPELAASEVPAYAPEREIDERRPAIVADALPQQRNFHNRVVTKEAAVEPLPDIEAAFPDRGESPIEAEPLRIEPEAPANHAVSQEVDREPALPFSAKQVTKEQSKMAFHRTALANPTRVDPEADERELRRIRPSAPIASPPAGFPVNQAFAFERPASPERSEKLVNEPLPKVRRPAAAATPTPEPLFSVTRTATLKASSPSPGAKPVARLFADSATVQRTDASVAEPAPVSRSFGTRRAGLLPVTPEIVPQFEHEKPVPAPGEDSLEKVVTGDVAGSDVEFTIEGPASGRDVIYKPLQLPELAIEMEVDIRLKFWVLPDGSVGEVVPLQRGDVRLERAAIQYLKSWRFTSVTDEREVWGIVPIRYTLQ